jgi:hypothetical protein
VRDAFSETYRKGVYSYPEFEDEFQRLLASAEQKAIDIKKTKQTPEPKVTSKSHSKSKLDSKTSTPTGKQVTKNAIGDSKDDVPVGISSPAENTNANTQGFDISKLKAIGKGKKEKKGDSAKEEPKKKEPKKKVSTYQM